MPLDLHTWAIVGTGLAAIVALIRAHQLRTRIHALEAEIWAVAHQSTQRIEDLDHVFDGRCDRLLARVQDLEDVTGLAARHRVVPRCEGDRDHLFS